MNPVFMNSNMDTLPVFDPTEGPHLDSWFPANQASASLVAVLEACKDTIRLIGSLDAKNPLGDARGLTLLATPLVSFADNVIALNKLLAKAERAGQLAEDRNTLRDSARALNRARLGPLRVLRNKRSAHHDREALAPSSGVPRPSPELLLSAMCHGLQCAILLLNYDLAFWWTRSEPGGPSDKVTIFGEVATTFRLDQNRKISEVESIAFTKDPRHRARAILEEAIAKYNALVEAAGTTTTRWKIVLRERPKKS